jgi:hypothetical protein
MVSEFVLDDFLHAEQTASLKSWKGDDQKLAPVVVSILLK